MEQNTEINFPPLRPDGSRMCLGEWNIPIKFRTKAEAEEFFAKEKEQFLAAEKAAAITAWTLNIDRFKGFNNPHHLLTIQARVPMDFYESAESINQNLISIKDSLQVLISTITDIEIHLKTTADAAADKSEAIINALTKMNDWFAKAAEF